MSISTDTDFNILDRNSKLLWLLDWATIENEKRKKGEDSEWEQGDWFTPGTCGTACCIAGKTALTTDRFRSVPSGIVDDWFSFEPANPGDSSQASAAWSVAEEVLELSNFEADVLFSGANDLEDLQQIIGFIVAGDIDGLLQFEEARQIANIASRMSAHPSYAHGE